MNSQRISTEMELLMLRYKRGLIPLSQAREELAFLLSLLKAQEQVVIEERLEKIEAAIEARQEDKRWQ